MDRWTKKKRCTFSCFSPNLVHLRHFRSDPQEPAIWSQIMGHSWSCSRCSTLLQQFGWRLTQCVYMSYRNKSSRYRDTGRKDSLETIKIQMRHAEDSSRISCQNKKSLLSEIRRTCYSASWCIRPISIKPVFKRYNCQHYSINKLYLKLFL